MNFVRRLRHQSSSSPESCTSVDKANAATASLNMVLVFDCQSESLYNCFSDFLFSKKDFTRLTGTDSHFSRNRVSMDREIMGRPELGRTGRCGDDLGGMSGPSGKYISKLHCWRATIFPGRKSVENANMVDKKNHRGERLSYTRFRS